MEHSDGTFQEANIELVDIMYRVQVSNLKISDQDRQNGGCGRLG